MKKQRIQTGLRVPKEQYDRVKVISERTGISLNSVMSQAIDIGLSHFERFYEDKK